MAVWIGGLLLAGTACITRAESVESRRRDFDRSGLGDVIARAAPAGLTPVDARLGDGIELVGWQAEPARPRPGDRVTVTLYWKAVEPPQESWKVFVHADPVGGRGGRINGDHEPAQGRYPTQVWREGEVVKDPFTLAVPAGYPASGIELWVGMFEGNDRLEVESRGRVRTDGRDRILAGVVPLE